jgi:phenylacetate-coenzyme A ligase PaaK-like adenylate-forming protein
MAIAVSPETYASRFDQRIEETLPEAARRSEAFAARLAAAGVEPEDLVDVRALDRIPILTKDELIDLQAAQPPFGGLLARGARVRRVFQSPGPLFEPELAGTELWRLAPALASAGFGPDDVVLNAFSYHLSPAGAMFEEAVMALGGAVVPAGVGNIELQARACRDLGLTGYVGLPSYLKALLERGEELGLEPAGWALERATVSGEPLPPALRAWLEERVPVVRQLYGTAEAGLLGYECDAKNGLHVPDDALIEICDPATGEALWDGREGEVVVTLFLPDYPLVRFGTGDLSAFLTEPCACGLAAPRIAGWLGRVGEAVKVRGMFLHPRQAQAMLAQIPDVSRFQLVVERVDHRDVLRCDVVAVSDAQDDQLAATVKARIRSGLRFDADVAVVDAIGADEPVIIDRRDWK